MSPNREATIVTERQPNPRRVAAGRRNRRLRGPLTPEGRERLRQAALANQPWLKSTGPRTKAGKAKVSLNGKRKQRTKYSNRELRALVAESGELVDQLAELRVALTAR